MAYKFDYLDGEVLRWSLTEVGAEYTVDVSYTPTISVSTHGGPSTTTSQWAYLPTC